MYEHSDASFVDVMRWNEGWVLTIEDSVRDLMSVAWVSRSFVDLVDGIDNFVTS